MTVKDYLDLITSAWRQKPKYTATITDIVSVSVIVQDLMQSMGPIFDVDTAAGDQLDIIGEWVGVSRRIAIPIPGVYFSWDDTDATGWDFGTWAPNQEDTDVTLLPDDAYRILIKAKIAANHWDGTIDGAYTVWDALFRQASILTTDDGIILTTEDGIPLAGESGITILIKDNQNMTYELGFVGSPLDSLTFALVVGGYIPLKPEGVRLVGVFTPSNDGALFAWDVESDFLAGWDEGSWVNETAI